MSLEVPSTCVRSCSGEGFSWRYVEISELALLNLSKEKKNTVITVNDSVLEIFCHLIVFQCNALLAVKEVGMKDFTYSAERERAHCIH